MGVVEGQILLPSNKWEEVRRRGQSAIKQWIDEQMKGKSCVVVLIGHQTAHRPWVKYEITKAWNDGKGVVGVNIHRLLNENRVVDLVGPNPFAGINVGATSLARIAKRHNPPGLTSKHVRANIEANLSSWVEEAINIRNKYA